MINQKRTIIVKLVGGISKTYFEVTSISSNSNELSIWHDNDEILTKFEIRDVEGFTFVQEFSN